MIKQFLANVVAAFVVGVALIAPVLIYYYLFGYGAYTRR